MQRRVYIVKYKIAILSCLFFVGIFGLAVAYYWGHLETFYNELFWGSILISSASVFFIISDSKTSEPAKLVFLFLYGIVIYLPSLLWSPNFFHFTDEVMVAKISQLVYEYGNTQIGYSISLPMEIIRLYPGLPLLIVVLKNISGLSLFYAAKFTIALIHSMLLIFIYLLFKKISTPAIAFLGAFIYTTNINYTFFSSLFAYESLGLPLFILVLLMVTKLKELSKWAIVTIIFITSLTIVHHFSSYILLFILLLIVFLMINNEKIIRLFALTSAIIFFYIAYMAKATVEYFLEPIKQLVIRIIDFRYLEESNKKYAIDLIPIPKYEFLISRYIYPLLIVLLFTIGLYLLFKNHKKYLFLENSTNKVLIKTFVIFSILAFFLPLIALKGFGEIGRVLSFGYVGVSLISAIAMNYIINDSFMKQKNKIVVLILVFLLVIGSISIGNKLPWREPSPLSGVLASGDSTTTIDVFQASDWFKERIGEHQPIFGDKTIGTVFGKYGSQEVDEGDSAFIIFLSDSINTSILEEKSYITKIVIDRRISKLMPENKNYFYTSFEVNISTPVPEQSLNKFDHNYLFSNIYSNGNIDIYNIKI